jgi:hypothetical protein
MLTSVLRGKKTFFNCYQKRYEAMSERECDEEEKVGRKKKKKKK